MKSSIAESLGSRVCPGWLISRLIAAGQNRDRKPMSLATKLNQLSFGRLTRAEGSRFFVRFERPCHSP